MPRAVISAKSPQYILGVVLGSQKEEVLGKGVVWVRGGVDREKKWEKACAREGGLRVGPAISLWSENSRRLWLFPGSLRGFPRKIAGKSREDRRKTLRDLRNASNSTISDLFCTQISGRKFLPELSGEIHPGTAPLQALRCALALQNRALFEGEKMAKMCQEKERKGGGQQRGKKEKGRVETGQKFLGTRTGKFQPLQVF